METYQALKPKRVFIRGWLVWIGLFTFNFREYLNNITNKKEVKK